MLADFRILNPSWGVNYAPGWLLFAAEDSEFVSQGIAWFQRGDLKSVPVTHVAVVSAENEVVEALGKGVVRSPIEPYFRGGRPVYVKAPVGLAANHQGSWVIGRRVADNARKLVGLPYGYGLILADGLANLAAGRLLNRLTGGLPNHWVTWIADRNELAPVCSVLAAMALCPDQKIQAERGLKPALRTIGCLAKPARQITPQILFDDQELFP